MRKRAIVLIVLAVALILAKNQPYACCESEDGYFTICQPDSSVCVREHAKRTSQQTGYLTLGDWVASDGRTENGYTHVIGITEAGEGWVFSGSLVEDEPVIEEKEARIKSNGRVACRRYVNGARRKWLKNGDKVVVYAWCEEWCITNQGFIKTEYLSAEQNTETGKQ